MLTPMSQSGGTVLRGLTLGKPKFHRERNLTRSAREPFCRENIRRFARSSCLNTVARDSTSFQSFSRRSTNGLFTACISRAGRGHKTRISSRTM